MGSPGRGVLTAVGWGRVANAVGKVASGLQPAMRRLKRRKISNELLRLGIQYLPKRRIKQADWMGADFRGEYGKHKQVDYTVFSGQAYIALKTLHRAGGT